MTEVHGDLENQLVAPQLLAGRYLLLSWVGAGGMGSVYKARDIELDEVIALKLMRSDWSRDAEAIERFRREVRLARRIAHVNVVRTFDIGEHDGEPFLTMEYVPGRALSTAMIRGGLPVRRVVEIAMALCGGLGAAHEVGIVHRDLKPDNILVTEDGRVAITDFGLALARLAHEEVVPAGRASGTPGYMSPEQTVGEPLDHRADLYGLGAITYELVTGEPAWTGGVGAIAVAQATKPPPDPRRLRPDLPEPLAQMIVQCMARAPDRRFASAAEVAALLATVPVGDSAASAPTRAKPPTPSPMVAPSLRRKRLAVLPLRNLGPDEDGYLADGLTEELIDALSMIDGLQVRPRAVVARFRDTELDPRDLGRVLEVDAVVEGSLHRVDDQVRLGVRLLSVEDGFQVWARRFVQAPSSLLAVSLEVAGAIAEALTVRWQAPTAAVPDHREVVELYLRARAELREFWLDHARRAEELLVQALALAPDAPMLVSALALARQRISLHSDDPVAAAAARETAARAVALAPQLAQSWLALGLVNMDNGAFEEGVTALRKALRCGPAVAEAHDALGKILIEVGLVGQGMHRLKSAASLDPDSAPTALVVIARVRALLGDHAGAEAALATAERTATTPQRRITDFIRARLGLWRGESEPARRFGAEQVGDPTHRAIRQAFLDIADRTLSERTIGFLRGQPEWTSRSMRVRLFFGQLLVELAAVVGRDDLALEALEVIAAGGLIDRVWIDRCPLLARFPGEPRFAAARARVHARAQKIEVAYRGPGVGAGLSDTTPR